MKFTVTVSLNLIGCTKHKEFEIDDDELAEYYDDAAREEYIEEAAQHTMFQMIEWNFKKSEQ